MFKFYLNNIQVQDALNWVDFTETLERDETIKGLLPKYDVKLNFSADGYQYLFSQLQTSGYCNLVELKVEMKCDGNYSVVLNGYIFISDCKFNLNKCTVECAVIDNNYGAKIYNNKNIKAYLNVAISKNGVAIPAIYYDLIQLFTPTTGVYSGTTRELYSVYDAFRFLIDFMSDGTIGYESDFLSNSADPFFGIEGLRIGTGHEIRTAAHTNAPFISFQDLFQEINKKYPIGFTIVTRSGVPTIKIEDAAYFFNSTNIITIPNINDLQQSFNNELLYSSVKFGGTAVDTDATHSFEQVRFFNFLEEEYHLQGDCNIDKVLDLTATFIADSNIIEGLFATDTSNEAYDDNVIFVQSYGLAFATNSPDPITQLLPVYYNDNLKNNEVAERLSLQGNIALYLGNNDDLFLALSTSSVNRHTEFNTFPVGLSISALIAFQNDSVSPAFDTNGRYDNTLYKYTAIANGVYSFESNINISFGIIGQYKLNVAFSVFNAANVIQARYYGAEYTFTGGLTGAFFNTTMNGLTTIYLPAGWYVTVNILVNRSSINMFISLTTILIGSTFACTASVNGGGVYQPEDLNSYFVSKFEFEKAINNADYSTLKLDLSKSILINNDGQTNKTCWLRKSVRKLATGETTWELISNLDNS